MFSQASVILFTIGLTATRSLLVRGWYAYYWNAFLFFIKLLASSPLRVNGCKVTFVIDNLN